MFWHKCQCLKLVNHDIKILDLAQPNADWFRNAIYYYGLVGLCVVAYMTIHHGMHAAFAVRWHSKTSSFHLPIGDMTITLDDVSCLPHLLIRGKLPDHRRLGQEEAVEIMDPTEVANDVADTRGAHARFKFLEQLYKTNCNGLRMPMMMICMLSTTDSVHWGVTSCSQLWFMIITGASFLSICSQSWERVVFGRQSRWQETTRYLQ